MENLVNNCPTRDKKSSASQAGVGQWLSVDLWTKRSRLDSQPGHMPGLQDPPPLGGVQDSHH